MITWTWQNFWAYFKTMPEPTANLVARRLDLERFLPTLGYTSQVEVLKHAPTPVILALSKSKVTLNGHRTYVLMADTVEELVGEEALANRKLSRKNRRKG